MALFEQHPTALPAQSRDQRGLLARGFGGRLDRRALPLVLMFLPGFALFLLFKYVPLYGVLVAFKDYRLLDGIWASPWVGLEHFQRLFTGPGFALALRNTLIIALLKLVFVFPAPIVLALLLNELRSSLYKRIIQTVSYLPHFFSCMIRL